MLARLLGLFIYRLDLTRYAVLDRLCAMLASVRPCLHPWNALIEVGLTDDCRYGCKVMECSCGIQVVIHRRIYGCPQGL